MVRIYYKNSSDYTDISMWSLVKANFLSSLILGGIFFGITYSIALIIELLV